MKKLALLLSLLIIFISFLVLWDVSHAMVGMHYAVPGISFSGRKSMTKGLAFDRVSGPVLTLTMRTAPPVPSDLILYWNHTPYRFSSLTSSTLKSLGFTVNQYGSEYSAYFQKRGGRSSRGWTASFVLYDKGVKDFNMFCRGDYGVCPFGFSYRRNPEMRFPITEGTITGVFGPAPKTESARLHPIGLLLRVGKP